MLRTVKTVIVDEIHALARDKRGSHLALSLERLEALAGPFQRIGLSATQKPLSEVAQFLVGVGRECELVDVGHRREMDVAVVVPPSPLSTVCSHEQWDEIYKQIAELINEHRTTLVFVNTRKLAERITARLTDVMGAGPGHLPPQQPLEASGGSTPSTGSRPAACGRWSRRRRWSWASTSATWTWSIQVGATRSIATFLQRVGRSGHAIRRDAQGAAVPADGRRAGRSGGAAARDASAATWTARRSPRRRWTSSRSRSSPRASRRARRAGTRTRCSTRSRAPGRIAT